MKEATTVTLLGCAGFLILTCSGSVVGLAETGGLLPIRNQEFPDGYVGQDVCAACHTRIYKPFQQVGMARSLYRPTSENVIEDYQQNNSIFHEKSGLYYTMVERDGRFFQRRYVKNSDGQPIHVHEEEVTYIVGSSNHARSYLHHHPNGVITQLPLTWYAQERRWAMSPGYDAEDHPDFTRAVPQGCIFCHTAYPRLIPERAEDQEYFPYQLPTGIACERCHGPGQEHVRLALKGEPAKKVKGAIYNPALDSKQAQREVCYQCHMETSVLGLGTRIIVPGRRTFSYRPGETFSEYAVQLFLRSSRSGSERFHVVQHAELMEESNCFKASNGELTCTTCHDPHRKVPLQERASYYRRRCMSCHVGTGLSGHEPSQLEGDCILCHMPRGEPVNAPHTVFTNHRIGTYLTSSADVGLGEDPHYELEVEPGAGELGKAQKLFFLGAGYLHAPLVELRGQLKHVQKGIQLLEDYLTKEIDKIDNISYRAEAYSLLGKGYQALNMVKQAIDAYERSLKASKGRLQPLYNLGLLWASLGDLDRSESYFSSVLERFPDFVPAIHGLGALSEAAGENQAAIRYFDKAIGLFPGAVSSHYRLAQIYLRQQEWEKATTSLKRTLSLSPKFLPAYLDLSNLYGLQNRLGEAQDMLDRALRLDPQNQEARQILKRIKESSRKRRLKK